MTIELDHLAVAGETLEEATAEVEDALGVALDPGGVHVEMGTHNRLLSLGPGVYLEAIAINPDAAAPKAPRWFDLDRFAGPPRLTNWIVRTGDLATAVGQAPRGMGMPIAFQRGDYAWTMAVPGSGCLPFDGAAPALIQWDVALHPADVLEDRGCRLDRLEIAHPEAERLRTEFPALTRLHDVCLTTGDRVELMARIITPHGPRILR